MKKVGVIGGSGVIESHVISLLLEHNFDIKVSTIDILKKENYEHLMELNHSENLYVCEMNSEEKSALHHFAKDCDIVIFMNPEEIHF